MRKVHVIPASIQNYTEKPLNRQWKRKVAGYARVSTDHDEQLTSYEAQVDYYTRYIQSRNNWEFVGMYTDEGISATNTKHRKGFKRMIDDAMTAHVSIVFARYTMLSLEQRRNADKRSIGDLFFASYDELQDLRYMDALLLILKKFIDRIKERMLFMEKELDEMLNSFLEKLPLLWHNCLKHCWHLRSHIPLLCIIAGLFGMCEV